MGAKSIRQFYLLAATLTIGGWAWLLYFMQTGTAGTGGCLFHYITGIACPACGSTRAVNAIFSGNILLAYRYNPVGYVAACGLVVLPVWLLKDALFKTPTLYGANGRFNNFIKQHPAALVAIAVVLITNWIWTIAKHM